MTPRIRAVALALLAASVTCTVVLYARLVWAGEGSPAEATIPISTGAGGLGVGAIGAWVMMHGRLKAAETALASIGPALPSLLGRVEQLVANLEQLQKTIREDGLAARNKIHDIRGAVQKHEGRLIRLEERFNGLRDAVEAGDTRALPRPITEDVTGPVDTRDTGPRRRV